ncbi:hypothetical protein CSC70_07530 [Pseudoxanthomonas kalamensis DSM 18571]|nr:hypothetical protein CSC70_07530 [Pseudoxanthomonas kalamensis DSM 18571]
MEVAMGEAPAMHLSLDYGERMLEVAQSQPLADAVGFAGTADDGSAVKLVIVREDCSDGMSDQIYPASAMLGVGDREYRGCGRFLFD